jgi:hypothetical protein
LRTRSILYLTLLLIFKISRQKFIIKCSVVDSDPDRIRSGLHDIVDPDRYKILRIFDVKVFFLVVLELKEIQKYLALYKILFRHKNFSIFREIS